MNTKVLAQDNPATTGATLEKARGGAAKPLPEDALILIPMRNSVLFPAPDGPMIPKT